MSTTLIKNSLIESYNSLIFKIRNDVHESSYFFSFCCIILNHNSMANNIHIKIYHQNINKYIIKEQRAKISFDMERMVFFNKIIASVYNKLKLNSYNNSKSVSIDINESFLFINNPKFYRIHIPMNKELYNNLLNRLMTECGN